METENPRRLSGVHQNAAFIASMGWKSRNSAPLSVEGQVFSLTFPFIEQAIARFDLPMSVTAIFRQ